MRLAYLIVQVDDNADPDRVIDYQGQWWLPDNATHQQIGEATAAALAEIERMRREHPGMHLQLVTTQRIA